MQKNGLTSNSSNPSLTTINWERGHLDYVTIKTKKQKTAIKDQQQKKKNLEKINGKYNNICSVDEKKYHCCNFFLCQKLKSRVSFIQLKPILCGFSFSSCSLKLLSLLLCLLKYVLNYQQNFPFFIFRSGLYNIWINYNWIREGLL
jgi:hypothetical protein